MSEWTHKNGVDGIRRQAQEPIEQAYQRGYKAGQENALVVDSDKFREQGRNEAWEAARKIMSQNDASWSMKDMKEIFGLSYSTDIMLDLKASEAIEKIHAYEQKKQNEAEEIHVGDEVLFNGIAKAVVLRTRMRGLENYCFIICADGSGGECEKLKLKKTGRTFPEIAEVLKKMQET